MEIKRTRDQVVITTAELTKILCDYVFKETGRTVSDQLVRYNINNGSFNAALLPLKFNDEGNHNENL